MFDKINTIDLSQDLVKQCENLIHNNAAVIKPLTVTEMRVGCDDNNNNHSDEKKEINSFVTNYSIVSGEEVDSNFHGGAGCLSLVKYKRFGSGGKLECVVILEHSPFVMAEDGKSVKWRENSCANIYTYNEEKGTVQSERLEGIAYRDWSKGKQIMEYKQTWIRSNSADYLQSQYSKEEYKYNNKNWGSILFEICCQSTNEYSWRTPTEETDIDDNRWSR